MNISTDAVKDLIRLRRFDWLDYCLFGLMLSVSALIGIYFGCFGNKQKKTVDYLHGGKTMAIFPVAVSLVASSISGITMMGVPSEIYLHGTMYWYACVGAVIMGFIVYFVYLPVFFKLQCTSTFEYLETRFNHTVRRMASVMYTISLLLYIPIVVYVPALAFSHVSGMSVHVISPLVCIICIFYTMLGGLKAVVWTDFIQGFLIVGSGLIVIILGVINVEGFGTVYQRSLAGDRIQFSNLDPSPLERDTVWTVLFGTTFMWMSNTAVNQGYVQKSLSMPDLASAKKALVIFVIGVILMKSISCFTGLLIYATYFDCDPLATKAIHRPDQLLPYFVMDTATGIPGLPGIFIAGVFSAALSTMSSSLNSLSASIFEDMVHPCLKGRLLESRANLIMKAIVVVVGAVCVLMVFVVEQLGTVLELSYSVGAVTNGALLGLFSVGMFFPWVNVKGAMTGGISGMILVGWLVTGAQNAMKNGSLKHAVLSSTIEGCGFNSSVADALNVAPIVEDSAEEVFVLFRIAFYYFGVIGFFWVVIVSLIASFLTGPLDPNSMNTDLFVPFIEKYVTFNREREDHACDELLTMKNHVVARSNGVNESEYVANK